MQSEVPNLGRPRSQLKTPQGTPAPGETEESGCCPSCFSNLLTPVLSLCLICCSPHPNPWFVIQSEEGKKRECLLVSLCLPQGAWTSSLLAPISALRGELLWPQAAGHQGQRRIREEPESGGKGQEKEMGWGRGDT